MPSSRADTDTIMALAHACQTLPEDDVQVLRALATAMQRDDLKGYANGARRLAELVTREIMIGPVDVWGRGKREAA